MTLQLIVGCCSLLTLISHSTSGQLLQQAKSRHGAQLLSNQQLKNVAHLTDFAHLQAALDELLVPRVVGTPGHEKVYNYIVNELGGLGWHVETDEFQENTPIFGRLTFKNIVASLNAKADRFLVFACHYDSKYFKDFDFIGATDSAVPCAMMLNLAKVLKTELDAAKERTDLSLQLIFFDGEEAFKEWNARDSLYGARHLSKKMSRQLHTTTAGERSSALNRIDVLVLLDLIGAPPTHFDHYFRNTERWYIHLAKIEERLRQLQVHSPANERIFTQYRSHAYVEDDHTPFLKRNVPVLHLISTPFPDVWHTEGDNRDIVDIESVEEINQILRIFVAEYLHLKVFAPDWLRRREQSEEL